MSALTFPKALEFPDGLRLIGGQTFVMAEGGGTLDRVTVKGDDVQFETLQDDLAGPTAVALVDARAGGDLR